MLPPNFIFWIFCPILPKLCVIGENGHISAQGPPIQKIKVLSFLQLLKLKKRKCLYFFYWRPLGWDMAIFLFLSKLPNWTKILNFELICAGSKWPPNQKRKVGPCMEWSRAQIPKGAQFFIENCILHSALLRHILSSLQGGCFAQVTISVFAFACKMTATVKSISCGPAQCFYQVAVAKCENGCVYHCLKLSNIWVR